MYKWVPGEYSRLPHPHWVPDTDLILCVVREENKESVKEDDQGSHKENQVHQTVKVVGSAVLSFLLRQSVDVQSPAQTNADPLLPEIESGMSTAHHH